MALKLITAPALEPISLTEAKLFLRVTGTDEDALLTSLIKLARERAEALTHRALITQTWEETFDYFPLYFELQKPPLQSVTSVKYYDVNGILQTLDPTYYQVDLYSTPAKIARVYNQSNWPTVRLLQLNPIIIKFVCGYGSAGNDVPEQIRHWMRVRINEAWENREANVKGTIVEELPYSYLDGLLDAEFVSLGGC